MGSNPDHPRSSKLSCCGGGCDGDSQQVDAAGQGRVISDSEARVTPSAGEIDLPQY